MSQTVSTMRAAVSIVRKTVQTDQPSPVPCGHCDELSQQYLYRHRSLGDRHRAGLI
jgi:hypothetical protein